MAVRAIIGVRTTHIETYFSAEVQPDLVAQGMLNVEAFQCSQELLARAYDQQLKDATDAAEQPYQSPIRNQGFRRAIVTAYEHRCAFCGIRLLTAEGHTAVAAAHIVPWSVSHDDNVQNGLALCRLCHWTFDEGLLAVSSGYELLASPQLSSTGNVPGHLPTLKGRLLLGPADAVLWPDGDNLAWHRRERFRRG